MTKITPMLVGGSLVALQVLKFTTTLRLTPFRGRAAPTPSLMTTTTCSATTAHGVLSDLPMGPWMLHIKCLPRTISRRPSPPECRIFQASRSMREKTLYLRAVTPHVYRSALQPRCELSRCPLQPRLSILEVRLARANATPVASSRSLALAVPPPRRSTRPRAAPPRLASRRERRRSSCCTSL